MRAKCEHRKTPSNCVQCGGFLHRAKAALRHGVKNASRCGYAAPRITVEELTLLMRESQTCFLCGGSLDWTGLACFITPHLHHSHKTGLIFGFVHPTCNRVEGLIQRAKKDGQNVNFCQLLLTIARLVKN